MTMKVKGAVAGGRVVGWTFDVWSQSHNMRPGDPDGINLMGSWYLADAKRPGPARHAAQPNGAGDRNAITLYDFPRQRTTHHLIMENPVRTSADAGQIINPGGLTNQIEGGVIQSMSWTVHEHVRFDRNGILSEDWMNYPILTMPDVPRVETVLINRPNERALGAGEAAPGPTAAAIANAFAAATGRRIRELPLTPERVKVALA